MAKATIIIHTDDQEELRDFERWQQLWQGALVLSENKGCGCCVKVFEVEGQQDAIDAIPQQVLGATDWLAEDIIQGFHLGR